MEPALVARINGIFNQVLQVPAVRSAITEAQAADIVGGTPQQFDAFIKSELQRWPEVVKTAGIKSEYVTLRLAFRSSEGQSSAKTSRWPWPCPRSTRRRRASCR